METHQQEKRAYRNEKKGMIGGVCEGLGEYFNIDPTIFRVIFIVLLLASGSGVLLYIILWIVLPEKPVAYMEEEKTYRAHSETPPRQYNPPRQHRKKNNGSLIGGLILIVIGGLFLLEKFLPNINFKDYWPLILIIIGIVLVVRALQGKDEDA